MADTPTLTVAVPTMNGAAVLAATLRSILAQDGEPFDLLVCDDRSDDETLDLIRREAGDRARVEVNPERLGLAGNWNRCVALSRTPCVAIVHQDDLLLPGHLAAHATIFRSDPTAGLVASASTTIDEQDRDVPASVVDRGGLGPADRTFRAGEALPLLAAGNPFRCSAVSTRVAAHTDVGGFDPAYRYVVDWDFWSRTARRWSVAWLARPTVAMRWHLASETHRFKTGTRDLEESERLLAWFESNLAAADLTEVNRGWSRLARAYLNRAYEAARARQPQLARCCLRRALQIRPRLAGTILTDPKLAARLTAACLMPR